MTRTPNALEKEQIFIDMFEGRMPKRVPVTQPVDLACALELKGFSLTKEQYSPEKCLEAIDYTTSQIDSDVVPVSASQNAVALRINGSKKFVMGGDGYIQHQNHSFMEPEEYPEYAKDIYWFNATKGVDRAYEHLSFTGSKDISPMDQATMLLRIQLANQNFNEVMMPGRAAIEEKYERTSWDSYNAIGCAPLDTLADFNRSFSAVLGDIRRYPQQVMDAVEALTEFEKARVDRSLPGTPGKRVFFALHMATFMRPKDVAKFFWPSFMEVINFTKDSGRNIYVFCEDNWDPYIDMVSELPEGTLIRFEKTNPKLAREACGYRHIFNGFFPMELYYAGSVENAIDRTKEFLDVVAPGGKYQFQADKSPIKCTDVNLDNVKAIIKTVKEYGVY